MKSGKPVKRSRKERREEKEKMKKKAVITDERFAEVYTNPVSFAQYVVCNIVIQLGIPFSSGSRSRISIRAR